MNRHFDPDDPRLTAYVLGELDEADRAEIEAELERNEDAREAVAEIRAMADMLTRELQNEPHETLTPEQRAAVLEGPGRQASPRRFGRYFALVTGAAACLALFAGVAYMSYTRSRAAQSTPTMLAKGERQKNLIVETARRPQQAEPVQPERAVGARTAERSLLSVPSSAISDEPEIKTVDAVLLNDRDVAETSYFGLRTESDEGLGDTLDKSLEETEPLTELVTNDLFARGETAAEPEQARKIAVRVQEDTTAPSVTYERERLTELSVPAPSRPKPKSSAVAIAASTPIDASGGAPSGEPGRRYLDSGSRITQGIVVGPTRLGATRLGVEARFGDDVEEAELDQLKSLGYIGLHWRDGPSSPASAGEEPDTGPRFRRWLTRRWHDGRHGPFRCSR